MISGNGIDQCDCCGRDIKPGKIVWLELDQRINCYHDFCGGVPEEHSQGLFPFGPTCAARLCREASEASKKAGVYLGRRRISKAERAMRSVGLKNLLSR